jgi:hypothetical protein
MYVLDPYVLAGVLGEKTSAFIKTIVLDPYVLAGVLGDYPSSD